MGRSLVLPARELVRRYWRHALTAVLLIAAALMLWCRPKPTPLPRDLGATLERHTVATAVDTVEIHRLERVATSARSAQRAESISAARFAVAAITQRHRADSLALAASQAETARDSLTRIWTAYEARTSERDTLLLVVASQATTIALATVRGDSLEVALVRSEARATRADAVIASAVQVVRASDPPCRFLGVFQCPSRTTVAIGGAMVGVGAVYVATHILSR